MGYNRRASQAVQAYVSAGTCTGCGGAADWCTPADGWLYSHLNAGLAGDSLHDVLERSTRWCVTCRPKPGSPRKDPAGRLGLIAAAETVQSALAGRVCEGCGAPATAARLPGERRLGELAYGGAGVDPTEHLAGARFRCQSCLQREAGLHGRADQLGVPRPDITTVPPIPTAVPATTDATPGAATEATAAATAELDPPTGTTQGHLGHAGPGGQAGPVPRQREHHDSGHTHPRRTHARGTAPGDARPWHASPDLAVPDPVPGVPAPVLGSLADPRTIWHASLGDDVLTDGTPLPASLRARVALRSSEAHPPSAGPGAGVGEVAQGWERATSRWQVLLRLGLKREDSNYLRLRAAAAHHGIPLPTTAKDGRAYGHGVLRDDDTVRRARAGATTMQQMCKNLGVSVAGNTYVRIRARLAALDLPPL